MVGDRCAGLVATVELDAAQGEVPTLHGAFHAQRALQGPADPQGMGVRRPEGDIRHGKPGIRAGQSRNKSPRRWRSRRLRAAANCLREGVGETTDLPAGRVPGRAPQAHPHEQHDRAVEQGDPPAHARRGRLPRREQRAHARLRAASGTSPRTNGRPAATSTCPGSMTTSWKRTDHRSMDGHDPKCATFRALPIPAPDHDAHFAMMTA